MSTLRQDVFEEGQNDCPACKRNTANDEEKQEYFVGIEKKKPESHLISVSTQALLSWSYLNFTCITFIIIT